jgi:alpha-glucosidase (family GH31 glycosyl hydrolase)
VPVAERVSNGHPLLPPKWAFGVLWGSYFDQNGTYAKSANVPANLPQTLPDAATKIRNEYAGDLMWVDSTWLFAVYSNGGASGAYYLCFKYDNTTFPDPVGMIKGLRAQHFHYGTWSWPWMGHGCSLFTPGVNNKYFVMNGGTPALASGGWHGDPTPAAFDFTNPATVTWWQMQMKPYIDAGQDFFKLDTNETQVVSWKGSGGVLADPTKDYVHEYHRTEYEASKLYAAANDPNAKMNGARGVIMPKQRSPNNDQIPGWWTDDQLTSFDGMKAEMTAASALDTPQSSAYWCGDTGGYKGSPPSNDVYERWIEYSAFTPLQEFFGPRSEGPGDFGAAWPWLFSAQSQMIQKQYASLRYRLLPFRYSNAQSAYHESTVVYPVRWIGNTQIISGNGTSDILVQPITAAGQLTTSVALPAGSNWIHYWTGMTYMGGTTAMVATPIDQAAIFVKAGSIIPMGPDLKYVDEKPADPLTLDIYAAGATSYKLYEDDGVSEGYLGGAYSTTAFHADDTGGKVVVVIDPQIIGKYDYAGRICSRGYVLKINRQAAAPAGVARDGKAVMSVGSSTALDAATEGFYYDSMAQTLWVKFHLDSSQSTKIQLM